MLEPSDLDLPGHFTRYWPGQLSTIQGVATSRARIDSLCAPTGSGKSLIYMSAAALRRILERTLVNGRRTLVLVSTKALQAQLLKDFGQSGGEGDLDFNSLYTINGHSSYPCGQAEYDDMGNMTDFECALKNRCHYLKRVGESLCYSSVVTNYAHWAALSQSEPARLGSFDYLVVDEAHLVPDLLVEFVAAKISSRAVFELLRMPMIKLSADSKRPTSQREFTSWCREAAAVSLDRISDLDGQSSFSQAARRELKRVQRLCLLLTRVVDAESDGIEWIAQPTRQGAEFKPVWGESYIDSWLFRGVKKIVLCSATLTSSSRKYFGRSIAKSSSHIELQSTYPAHHRPLIYIPTVRVAYGCTLGETRKWVRRIDSIIEGRLDRNGIIHTRSYARADLILSLSKYRDIMVTHDTDSARRVIDAFKRSDWPKVLLSPSVEEGIDFPGDSCRYQIISKLPFLDMRDILTKARAKTDSTYINCKVSETITQIYGRPVRSPVDWAETFVIDDHWSWFERQGDFQDYIREASYSLPQVPPPLDLETEDGIEQAMMIYKRARFVRTKSLKEVMQSRRDRR